MRHRTIHPLLLLCCLFGVPQIRAQSTQGDILFLQRCAICHVIDPSRPNPDVKAPTRSDLALLTPERVLEMITTGPMAPNAQGLPPDQKIALAEQVALRRLGSEELANKPMAGRCATIPTSFPPPESESSWSGWSPDASNSRFQSAAAAGMTISDLGNLKLKWVFAFPGADTAFGAPTIVSGRVFVASNNGFVYSLDAKTGCYYWAHNAHTSTRTAINIGRTKAAKSGYAAYFGDLKSAVHAVDALTGEPIWQVTVDEQPYTRITGSMVLAGNRLIVPITSREETAGGVETYGCCKFRGKVVAVDASTGKIIWASFTIPEEPKPTKLNKNGLQLYGPSGASVWSTPTVDMDKKEVYITTGNNYTGPAINSDSLIAFDLTSGKLLWSQQLTKDDIWLRGCRTGPNASAANSNCADTAGPDADFGGAAVLHRLPSGKRILIVSQKNALVHALDADQKGAILWEARVGKGATGGGVVWGSAADEKYFYAAVGDPPGPEQGGLTALKLETGEQVWRTPAPFVACADPALRGCNKSQFAALSVIPGVVFSGSFNGVMRGYSTETGHILWEYDSKRDFTNTVNGIPARGGTINGPGPVFARGMMFMNSGYGPAGGAFGDPGNAFLAFGLD
jgi:polyvinyl alcohol dehydrogenase (cytochrome)